MAVIKDITARINVKRNSIKNPAPAAYINLVKERNGDIILLNCLAHSQRKFFDAQKTLN